MSSIPVQNLVAIIGDQKYSTSNEDESILASEKTKLFDHSCVSCQTTLFHGSSAMMVDMGDVIGFLQV